MLLERRGALGLASAGNEKEARRARRAERVDRSVRVTSAPVVDSSGAAPHALVCPGQIAYFEQMAPGEKVRLSGSLLGGGLLMVSERNVRHSVLILTFSTVLLSVCTVVSDRIFLFFSSPLVLGKIIKSPQKILAFFTCRQDVARC